MTIDELLHDGNWAQVFADENAGNVSKEVEAVPPGSCVSTSAFGRTDVAEILHVYECGSDAHELGEWEGVMIGRLKDGRWFAASGGCDYTGWD